MPIRTWEQIFGNGPFDISLMSPAEVEFYFPFATQPSFAAGSTLRSLGLNPNVVNPMTSFLRARAGDVSQNVADMLRAQGTLESSPQVTNRIRGSLAQGQISPFGGGLNAVRSFFGNLGGVAQQRNAGTLNNLAQAGLLQELDSPTQAFDFLMRTLGGVVAPQLLGSGRTQEALYQNLYDQFQRRANPNQTFLQSLLGMGI